MAQVTLGDFAPVNKSIWAVNNSTEADVIEKEKVEGVVELQDDVSDIKTADYGAGVNLLDFDKMLDSIGYSYSKTSENVYTIDNVNITGWEVGFQFSDKDIPITYSYTVSDTGTNARLEIGDSSGNWVTNSNAQGSYELKANGCKVRIGYSTGGSTTFTKPMIRSAEITDSTFYPYIKTNQQLQEDVAVLRPITVGTMYDADANAAVHNAHPRGKNITDIFNAGELSGMISSGLFDEIYPGDYFNLPMGAVTDRWSARTFTCRVMHLNPMKYVGDGTLSITDNHIGVATDESWFNCAWNESGTTAGGYAGSTIHGRINEEAIITAWQNALSSKLTLMQARMLLSNDVNTEVDSAEHPGQKGVASGWAWNTSYFKLMSEMERYGAPVWSSGKGFNTGTSNFQLAYYANNAASRGNKRTTWDWLSDVVSVSHAATGGTYGIAGYNTVATATGVRPLGFLKS